MRVPPLVVVTAGLAFKLWLWWRTAPLFVHHIICIVALWFFVAIMAAIWMERTEKRRPTEIYCSDWSSERSEKGVECQFKLRDAFGSFRPHEAIS
jgi:hypothetical protein